MGRISETIRGQDPHIVSQRMECKLSAWQNLKKRQMANKFIAKKQHQMLFRSERVLRAKAKLPSDQTYTNCT